MHARRPLRRIDAPGDHPSPGGWSAPAGREAILVSRAKDQEVCMEVISWKHRLAMTLGAVALLAAACGGGGDTSSSSSSSSTSTDTGESGPATDPANQGGTLNVGLAQKPTTFLAAGIVGSMTFAYVLDAPVVEGLLWYRSVDETASAKAIADFWAPKLATEVPTKENGAVKTDGCAAVTSPAAYKGAGGSSIIEAATVTPAMCVTWKLRDGVTWHDGSKFTAHDVCATHQFWFLKYGNNNPTKITSPNGWDQTIGCKEDSALQATVSYKTVYGGYLGIGSGVYGILPGKLLDNAFANGGDIEKVVQTVDLTVGSGNTDAFKGSDTLDKIMVGTGPYVLQKNDSPTQIIYTQNKNYWDKKHQPHLKTIIMKLIGSTSTVLQQAKAGSVDVGFDYRLRFLKDLTDTAKGGKLRVQTIPDSGAEKIDINICGPDPAASKCNSPGQLPSAPLILSKQGRKALLEAIPRQQIVDTVALGQTTVPQDDWHYLGAEFAQDSSIPTTKFDAAQAAKDLDAAGFKVDSTGKCKAGSNPGRTNPDGSCVVLNYQTTAGNQARSDAMDIIQAAWNTVGVATDTKKVDAGTFFDDWSAGGTIYNHQFHLAMYTNTMSSPAELDSYRPGYTCDQIPSSTNKGIGQNTTGVCDPIIDKGFVDGAGSVDLAKRVAAYKGAFKTLADLLIELPLYRQVTVDSLSVSIQGDKRNDIVWDFNMGNWYCLKATCQAA
jgi:peptide/nickel transport system substrate-binding protein